jgi:dienelactone hydrolase
MSQKRIILKRRIQGQRRGLELELAIHPLSNGVIVVNYPGITGDIDGYNNKYGQQADFIQEKEIGTVVRMGNPVYDELPYPRVMIDNFRYVIDHCLSHGKELSGKAKPTLYLMGFSAGASTIAAVAGDYSEVEKILLMAPSGDAGQDAVEKGLDKFKGEVYITVGDRDEIVGPGAGQTFYDLANSAKIRKLVIVPNCDHQFRGERNGKIMSKAPLWAFAGDNSFPSPDGGKKLYD